MGGGLDKAIHRNQLGNYFSFNHATQMLLYKWYVGGGGDMILLSSGAYVAWVLGEEGGSPYPLNLFCALTFNIWYLCMSFYKIFRIEKNFKRCLP